MILLLSELKHIINEAVSKEEVETVIAKLDALGTEEIKEPDETGFEPLDVDNEDTLDDDEYDGRVEPKEHSKYSRIKAQVGNEYFNMIRDMIRVIKEDVGIFDVIQRKYYLPFTLNDEFNELIKDIKRLVKYDPSSGVSGGDYFLGKKPKRPGHFDGHAIEVKAPKAVRFKYIDKETGEEKGATKFFDRRLGWWVWNDKTKRWRIKYDPK